MAKAAMIPCYSGNSAPRTLCFFCSLLVCFGFQDTVSLCGPGYPGTCFVGQAQFLSHRQMGNLLLHSHLHPADLQSCHDCTQLLRNALPIRLLTPPLRIPLFTFINTIFSKFRSGRITLRKRTQKASQNNHYSLVQCYCARCL